MKKADDYRRHAKECRELAGRIGSPEHRDQLMKMAELWDSLAEERTAFVQEHPEFAELPKPK